MRSVELLRRLPSIKLRCHRGKSDTGATKCARRGPSGRRRLGELRGRGAKLRGNVQDIEGANSADKLTEVEPSSEKRMNHA